MLNVPAALINRLDRANPTLDYTIADLTPEQLNGITDGATIASPGAIHFHTSYVQDLIINELLRGDVMRWDANNWASKFPNIVPAKGPSEFQLTRTYSVDSAAELLGYAADVRESTRTFIAGLTDDDLAAEVQFFTGPAPLINVLLGKIWETGNHTGEIAALRGVMGLKGLPF